MATLNNGEIGVCLCLANRPPHIHMTLATAIALDGQEAGFLVLVEMDQYYRE